MPDRFEETLVAHCSPTLAGHKCGSLFSYRAAPGESCGKSAERMDEILRPKGVRLRLLKHCADGCLAYVYRPAMLERRLAQPQVQMFLEAHGYADGSAEGCLSLLSNRIHCGEDFPHEIGVFLDYPLEDVIGFIEHRGRDYRCLGCWKAYGNEADARRRFALYHKCRRVYLECYRRGIGVARLTVAA